MNFHRSLFSSLCLIGLLTGLIILPGSAVEPVSRDQYLAYARSAADWQWKHFNESIQRWKDGFDPDNVFGYRPPGGLLEMAVIDAYFFSLYKNPEHASRAKKILLTYGDYRSIYPDYAAARRTDYADGIPVLPDFFTVMRYIRAYDSLKAYDIFSPAEHSKIAGIIADSMAYLLRTQEWGPMNRTALRAESLAWAVRALPNHPQKPVWDMLRRSLGDDNWGNWEIEDATIYHGVWLYALCGYSYAMDRMEELFKTPEMYYYAQYFLHLMSPGGMIPDFGDAHWQSNWRLYLIFFEAAARQYKDPELKWAATSIARQFVDFENPTSVGMGYHFLDCYLWGTDEVGIKRPDSPSQEVMEDVQGKKIVFRNGWEKDSTYMLLNYRDEGDGGLNFRDYLRDTIPVEEEKMTHGHADENSIVMLMSGGSLLLHDGGYRDYMPSGPYGAYRQDYFHNRLCVRPEKIWMGQNQGDYRYSIRDAVPGQGVMDFLKNAGSYRRVRTQKVDFLTFSDFDYSRTRLIDDNWGYESDRVIVYVKDPEIFVVFDILKSRREEFFTLANLWHTRKILDQGAQWFDTVYDRIQANELPDKKRLLIYFPQTHYRMLGKELQPRHYQEEWVIHQTTAQHFELGETVAMVTVLIPHSKNQSAEEWVERIELLPFEQERRGLGIKIYCDGKEIILGVKNDLRQDIIRDWRRPKYTYEAGKISFGGYETNADFLMASSLENEIRYTAVNLTKILYKGRILHEAKPALFGLAFDASPDQAGIGKLRYWRDTVPSDKRPD